MRLCAYCYLETETLLKCGKCTKRLYCSKVCQTLDWKSAGHKFYCGTAGELHVDFEIREAGDKGLGMFARRKFQRNDLIMVERPIFTMEKVYFEVPPIPETARHAVQALAPLDGSVLAKVMRNRMSMSDNEATGESGLFVTMSRMNHHCHGNADHRYMEHRGIKVLVARCDIESGEEICISYTTFRPRQERRAKLAMVYGFDCNCAICGDVYFEQQACRALVLDEGIMAMGSRGKIESALRQGKELLRIYDELHYSNWTYSRTYYDLFQVAITKRKYLAEGRKYAKKAMQVALEYMGDPDDPNVQRYQELMASPEIHRNYLIL